MSKEHIYISKAFSQKSLKAIVNTLSEFKIIETDNFDSLEDKKAVAFIIRSKNPVNDLMLQNCPNLKAVVSATSGFDHFDIKTVRTNENIFFGYTPDANASSAAELTIFHALNFFRKAPSLLKETHRKTNLIGNELRGKIVFIIGFGRIGKKVALLFKAFGCGVLAHDPYLESTDFKDLEVKPVSLKEGFLAADITTLHCPITSKTKHLINEKTLSLLNKDSLLINCARGELVSEKALIAAIENHKILGACLDVFEDEPLNEDSPLFKLNSVFCTPHAGAFTEEAHKESAIAAAQQVKFILKNGRTSHENSSLKKSPLTPLPFELSWFKESSPYAY